jgi:hypothetical protein
MERLARRLVWKLRVVSESVTRRPVHQVAGLELERVSESLHGRQASCAACLEASDGAESHSDSLGELLLRHGATGTPVAQTRHGDQHCARSHRLGDGIGRCRSARHSTILASCALSVRIAFVMLSSSYAGRSPATAGTQYRRPCRPERTRSAHLATGPAFATTWARLVTPSWSRSRPRCTTRLQRSGMPPGPRAPTSSPSCRRT